MAYVYHAPILTVDCVIFQIIDNELCVLLVKRVAEPHKGEWSIPGGYNAAGSTTREALEARVLNAKVGISIKDLNHVEQLYAFDLVGRDPRGHAVSITYMALGNSITLKTSKDTQTPTFYPVKDLWDLAFDHEDIVAFAHDRLKSLVATTSAIFALLPEHFTLTQLQLAYEAILGKKLDKRNFRKKFLAFDIVVSTGQHFKDGAHRPALLYRFKQRVVQPLDRSFA